MCCHIVTLILLHWIKSKKFAKTLTPYQYSINAGCWQAASQREMLWIARAVTTRHGEGSTDGSDWGDEKAERQRNTCEGDFAAFPRFDSAFSRLPEDIRDVFPGRLHQSIHHDIVCCCRQNPFGLP